MLGVLRPLGFKKSGTNFTRDYGEVYAMLNLQRSSASTSDMAIVTVNYGVYLKAVDTFLQRPSKKVASVYDAHWKRRIGRVLPQVDDKWWTLESEQDAGEAGGEI